MKKKKRKKKTKLVSRRLLRKAAKILGVAFLLPTYLVFLFVFVDPGPGFYMSSEARKLDGIKHEWKDIEHISPHLARSVVAAEDANFCSHFGFDIEAIKDAIEGGGKRGGSTISQQVAKNVFLWPGRSYLRKGLEAGFTVLIEVFWSKRRILEVYLNVAEFDSGVFGAEEAAKHYFGRSAEKLSPTQSARLAAVLPSPKKRSASRPSNFVRKRTSAIISGAGTIAVDGRSDCFEEG